jgi:carbon storage regulator
MQEATDTRRIRIMLVLTRKPAETIQIGDDVVIKVIRTGSGSVKLGVEAPQHIRVMRGELLSAPKALPTSPALCVVSDQFPHVA